MSSAPRPFRVTDAELYDAFRAACRDPTTRRLPNGMIPADAVAERLRLCEATVRSRMLELSREDSRVVSAISLDLKSCSERRGYALTEDQS